MTRTGTLNFEDLQMNYCLGNGQHASVHLVKDRSGNRYAMKVSHGVGRSLEKEFHIYCALSGTTPPVPPPSRPAPPYGIARVYGYESLDDHSRFVMQLLGPSLDSITEMHGPLRGRTSAWHWTNRFANPPHCTPEKHCAWWHRPAKHLPSTTRQLVQSSRLE